MRTLLLLPSVVALGALATAQIPSGCDCYVTESPPMGDSTVEIPMLGAGFFGSLGPMMDSDPFAPLVIAVEGEPLPDAIIAAFCPNAAIFETVWVDPHGTPVAPDDVHRVSMSTVFTGFEPIDTIVCRPGATTIPGVGMSEPVPIEMVELSLKSVAPITVTYGGGMDSRLWDVFITEVGGGPPGMMTITTTGAAGPITSGSMTMSSLPVDYDITFVETTGTLTAMGPVPGALDFLNPTPGNWQHDANAGAGAPANDRCQNANVVALGSNPFDANGADTVGGFPLDPGVCLIGPGDDQIYQDVWFTFTPGVSDNYDFEIVANTAYDSRIAIYNSINCPADPINVLDCDDDSGTGLLSLMAGVPLIAGTDYLIRCGTFQASSTINPADLMITQAVPPPPPPANDDCPNAIAAAVGSNLFDSTTATDGTGLPLDEMICDMGAFGDEQIYQDVWFTFTPSFTGNHDLQIFNQAGGATFDSRIAVYDQAGCPDDPANVIACNDDLNGLQAGVLAVPLVIGNPYLIRCGSFSATTTEQPADLQIAGTPPPPANDDCSNAEVITMHGSYAFDNSLATDDGTDLDPFCDMGPFGDEGMHKEVWFEYTPVTGGCTYITTLNLAGFDTRLAVFETSTCPADPATVVACSDDETGNPPFEAGMDVDLTAGTTYLIAVGNFGDTTLGGPATLMIGAGPAAQDGGGQPGAPGCAPPPTFTSSCNGDGGDQMGCTDCPCGNNAAMGTIGGCMNSSGNSTAIAATGDTSVSLPAGDTTDLRMTLSGAPASAFCVMLSGGGVAPLGMGNPCFGLSSGIQSADRDGLRCAVGGGQAVLRHGGRSANASGEVMDSSGPSRVWGGEASPNAGLAGQAGFAAGQTRQFQVTHREDALQVCMRGLNTSQALEVTFTP